MKFSRSKLSTWLLPASVLAIVPLAVRPGGHQQQDVISTQRLEIKDSNGKVRMVLGVDNKGETSIKMITSKGKERANIVINQEDDPSINFIDESGSPQIQLDVDTREGNTSFFMAERRDNASIAMNLANGRFVSVYRARGDSRAVLQMTGGKPTLMLQKGAKVKILTP